MNLHIFCSYTILTWTCLLFIPRCWAIVNRWFWWIIRGPITLSVLVSSLFEQTSRTITTYTLFQFILLMIFCASLLDFILIYISCLVAACDLVDRDVTDDKFHSRTECTSYCVCLSVGLYDAYIHDFPQIFLHFSML